MLLSRGRWPCHYSLHISWPLEIPALQFSHTCSIHLSGRQVSIHACVRGGGTAGSPRARQKICVSGGVVAEAKRSRLAAGVSRKEDLLPDRDTDGITKRQNSVSHCVTVRLLFFFPWEGLSLPTCVKVCFVFAAGLRHKASGSCLVKCWWRYYKVKSRVYKPAVCMVRAFPAEQWVSKLVW